MSQFGLTKKVSSKAGSGLLETGGGKAPFGASKVEPSGAICHSPLLPLPLSKSIGFAKANVQIIDNVRGACARPKHTLRERTPFGPFLSSARRLANTIRRSKQQQRPATIIIAIIVIIMTTT